MLTTHLKGHELNLALPVGQQAASLAAEIGAANVYLRAAVRDRAAGDVRAIARISALREHKRQLRSTLDRITNDGARISDASPADTAPQRAGTVPARGIGANR